MCDVVTCVSRSVWRCRGSCETVCVTLWWLMRVGLCDCVGACVNQYVWCCADLNELVCVTLWGLVWTSLCDAVVSYMSRSVWCCESCEPVCVTLWWIIWVWRCRGLCEPVCVTLWWFMWASLCDVVVTYMSRSMWRCRGLCEPVCRQGCQYGRCVLPDMCSCDFGYVGVNCSVECRCNKHSDCVSATKLDECIHCRNNTQVSLPAVRHSLALSTTLHYVPSCRELRCVSTASNITVGCCTCLYET